MGNPIFYGQGEDLRHITDTDRLNWLADYIRVDDVACDRDNEHEEPRPGITVDAEGLQEHLSPKFFYEDDDPREVLRELVAAAILKGSAGPSEAYLEKRRLSSRR